MSGLQIDMVSAGGQYEKQDTRRNLYGPADSPEQEEGIVKDTARLSMLYYVPSPAGHDGTRKRHTRYTRA